MNLHLIHRRDNIGLRKQVVEHLGHEQHVVCRLVDGQLVTVRQGSHVPAPGELRFPLDPLWASPAIDAVAIDAWWPLVDGRHPEGVLRGDGSDAALSGEPQYRHGA